MIDLKTRLATAAIAWCIAQTGPGEEVVPLSRLSKRVMDDGKFFDNLASMRRGPSTDTLEKFARYLADPVNWPANADGVHEVADEAKALAHVVGVNAPVHATSPRKSEDITPPSADAAQERVA